MWLIATLHSLRDPWVDLRVVCTCENFHFPLDWTNKHNKDFSEG